MIALLISRSIMMQAYHSKPIMIACCAKLHNAMAAHDRSVRMIGVT